MDNSSNQQVDSELRKRAEEKLREQQVEMGELSSEDVGHLVHELQVHQIQLEMQNEELRRVQLELQTTRDRFSDLYDFAPVGYLTTDSEDLILEANHTVAEMLGSEKNDLLSQQFSKFVFPGNQDTYYFHRRKLVESGEAQRCEVRLVKADGSSFYAQLEGCATRRNADGQIIQGRMAVLDITERKRAARDLRESEERWRSLTETSPDHIFTLDEELNIQFVNRASPGLTVDELIDTPLYMYVAEEKQLEIKEILETVLRSGKPAIYETEYKTPDGNTIYYESRVAPRMLAGESSGLTVSARDISEHKLAKEALRQYAAELEERNEELDAYAHTVAHDLKGPLSIAFGYARSLAEDFRTMDEGTIREGLQTIDEYTSKMNSIINELLLLASIRKEEVPVVPLDMKRIVDEVQQQMAPLIEQYQAEIVVPDTWPVVVGYAPWIEEVWINYISNALKYGGQPPRIELGSSKEEGGAARFWVRDNGQGVTAEEQSILFKVFGHLDQVRVKGHGLGLSIVRRIVEKLGGQVGVENVVGEGSVFSFTLPLDL